MTIFLLVVSAMMVVYGFLSLTPATLGVGLIGIACWFGILSRISQAETHHHELMEMIAASGQDVV
jgi:hypothetical protein